MSNECVFCRIIQRQLPAWILKEDKHIIVFLSKNNHPLVVPKKHLPTIYELDDLTATQVMQAAVQIARAVKTGLPCEGVYLTQANEAAAGQDVFHFHLHVYPRWSNVDFAQQQAPEEVSEEERRAAWQKIRSALAKR
jgi:histidine triad (HIT) family protein